MNSGTLTITKLDGSIYCFNISNISKLISLDLFFVTERAIEAKFKPTLSELIDSINWNQSTWDDSLKPYELKFIATMLNDCLVRNKHPRS